MPRFNRWRSQIGALCLALTAALIAPWAVGGSAQALVPTAPDGAFWGVNGRVRAILETSDAIYLGGDFTAVVGPSGQTLPRQNLAALDPQTGAPLPFAPQINGVVFDIARSPGGVVYAVGAFSQANNEPRARGAAFTTDGTLLPFNPRANSIIEAVIATDQRIYLGGFFTSVARQPKSRIAALDPSGAVVPTFAASADAAVHDLQLTPEGTQLVAGGQFSNLSGNTNARKLALLDPVTGAATALATRVPFEMFAVTATVQQIFGAGGGAGGHTYAFDRQTGLQQWSALSDGDAHGVRVQNGVLYVGGHFTKFAGQIANHAVAVSPRTGQVLPWQISVNSNLGVFTLEAYGGHISIGGDFTKVNRRPQSHFARFSEEIDTIPPSVPGVPQARVVGGSSVEVTWAAAVDNQATELTYQVYRNGLPIELLTSSSTTSIAFTDVGLTPGESYDWQVRAWDGANPGPLSPPSNDVVLADSGAPTLLSLRMQDVDTNGRIDRLVARFSAPILCTGVCLAPWDLSDVPSGGSLASVAILGDTATLTLDEGPGAPNTAVGGFLVSLTPAIYGVQDAQGRLAGFGARSPGDQAGPVPTNLATTSGATDNVMEVGDTFTVSFSEPIDPTTVNAANVKESDIPALGTDTLTIVGLSDTGIDLRSNDYVTTPGGTIVFAQATLTMLAANTQIQSTIVGPCTGTACAFPGPGVPEGAQVPITFRPEPTLKDLAGNAATGARAEAVTPY